MFDVQYEMQLAIRQIIESRTYDVEMDVRSEGDRRRTVDL